MSIESASVKEENLLRQDRVKHFLMCCWKENLYEQLYSFCYPSLVTSLPTIMKTTKQKNSSKYKGRGVVVQSSSSASSSGATTTSTITAAPQIIHHKELLTAMYISKIGVLLWSSAYSGKEDQTQNFVSCGNEDSNQLNNKTDSEIPGEDSTIISNNTGSSSQRNRRKVAIISTPLGNRTAKQLVKDFVLGTIDPHGLVTPYQYREQLGPAADEDQPFKVVVHPQVALVSDIHSHLSQAEVIGFLAGKWDLATKTIYVQAAIPCTSTGRDQDNGATDVELDPEAEWKARNVVAELGLTIIGWYHSHPRFRPNPSPIDIENQQLYQGLMRCEESGLQPFVGLIVSTFDRANNERVAQHNWFMVKSFKDDEPPFYEAWLPMQVTVGYQTMQSTLQEDSNIQELFQQHFNMLSTSCDIGVQYAMLANDTDLEPKPLSQSSMVSTQSTDVPGSNDTCSSMQNSLSTSESGSFNAENVGNDGAIEKRPRRAPKPKEIYDDSIYRKAKKQRKTSNKEAESTTESAKASSLSPMKSILKQTPSIEISKDDVYSSLVVTAKDTERSSSQMAKDILCATPIHLRYVAQVLISLGMYYSRYQRRVELQDKWKGANKLEKLQCSATRWFNLFRTADGSQSDPHAVKLFASILSLLTAAWTEYSKSAGKTGKPPKNGRHKVVVKSTVDDKDSQDQDHSILSHASDNET